MLTQEKLKEQFVYNSVTGKFRGRDKYRECDTLSEGYIVLTIQGKSQRAHRMAWLYIHGELPDTIDHINQIKHDNRLINLRNVSQAINNKNKLKGKVKGVYLLKAGNYRAMIRNNKKLISLGSFCCYEEACKARQEAEVLYSFHPNHSA